MEHHVRVPAVVIVFSSTSRRPTRLLEAARSLGVRVLVATDDSSRSDRHVRIDFSDPHRSAETIVRMGAVHPIGAVTATDDDGIMVAALAAARLGLRHSSPAAVAATLNKAMSRRALEHAGVTQPSFELTTPADDTLALVEYLGTPVVLKPLSLTGSAGIIRIDHPLEALHAEERIRRILASHGRNPNEPILVEHHVAGPEVLFEGVLTAGKLEPVALFDEATEQGMGAEFAGAMAVAPSRLHPEVLAEVETVAARSVAALGLSEGPVQVTSRVDGDLVTVVQVTAHPFPSTFARCASFDRDPEELLLRLALGMPTGPFIVPRGAAFGTMLLRTFRAGTLDAVVGVERVRTLPGITEATITLPLGTHLAAPPDASPSVGFLCASGRTPEAVRRSLRTALPELHIEVV
jgi:S-sulfo-L-cysteine synthase (3-phospho-L-serine-dependent)